MIANVRKIMLINDTAKIKTLLGKIASCLLNLAMKVELEKPATKTDVVRVTISIAKVKDRLVRVEADITELKTG